MVKLEFSKTAERELKKLASGTTVEEYLKEKVLVMLVDKITEADVLETKNQIEALQGNLNKKREEIFEELK